MLFSYIVKFFLVSFYEGGVVHIVQIPLSFFVTYPYC